MRRTVLVFFLFLASAVHAGPSIPAGDLVLRHDIQRLADRGLVSGPVTTWPLAWGPILEDLRDVDVTGLAPAVAASLHRVRDRANWETRTGELTFNASASVAEDPARIRSFQNSPRGKLNASGGAGWIDDWFSIELNVQGVDSDFDNDEARVDNSMIGAVLGNWSVAVSTQQRWWGPGWDGGLILSNSARPFPSLTIDRIFTDAFESKWLSWLGPWDMSVMFGQLEKERHIPNAQFFGLRFNFRPFTSLEVGLSRSAQWCGDGRPCDLDTFGDLFLGKDNRGDAGIGIDNEPGNQLAGLDFRWSPRFLGGSMAMYGQFIGEDEAGGFPSRYIGQLGLDGSGMFRDTWSYRYFAEAIATSCDFWKSDELFNCAYNHGIYQTGYRYKGRAIGHAADNDTRLFSAGVVLVDSDDTQWRGLVRLGDLNRAGSPDVRNSLVPTHRELASVDISHSRAFHFGVIDVGAGYQKVDDPASGGSESNGRFYIQWRSSY